jgi:archaellum component FlaC
LIVWDVETTSGKESASAMVHMSHLNEAVVDRLEDRLAKTFNEYVDTRQLYEEELRMKHVYISRIEELEKRVKALCSEVESLKEQLNTARAQPS